ncbi:hypothetical protein [uncultured Christiangramia sp.]|uniref:hypothetical protein n=1 Tax=uncultured Christiangramia sp. TaxID=503836 RepID=UPI002607C623|nr:hypothetical protein [uncultured Christiangramia sp.]
MPKKSCLVVYVVFLILLLIPFALRFADKSLEPYPAILFPSGPSTVKISGDSLSYYKNEVLVFDEKDSLVSLNSVLFQDFFDKQYFRQISGYGFGLGKTTDTISFEKYKIPSLKIYKKNKSKENELLVTKKWFNKIVKTNGYKDSLLILRRFYVTIHKENQKILKKEIKNEEIIELY